MNMIEFLRTLPDTDTSGTRSCIGEILMDEEQVWHIQMKCVDGEGHRWSGWDIHQGQFARRYCPNCDAGIEFDLNTVMQAAFDHLIKAREDGDLDSEERG